MKDKFTLGFMAGIIGAIVMNVMNYLNYYLLKLVEFRYLDYAGVITFGRLPATIGETVLAQIIQIGFSGVLGGLFALFIQRATADNCWLKGLVWGNGWWFILHGITVIYRLPVLATPDLSTALMQNISSAAYGITLGLAFAWLVEKAETKRAGLGKFRYVPVPAFKKEPGPKKLSFRKPKKL